MIQMIHFIKLYIIIINLIFLINIKITQNNIFTFNNFLTHLFEDGAGMLELSKLAYALGLLLRFTF